jgi:hypothetical protein
MNPLLAVLIVAQAQSWQVSIDSLVKNGDFSGVALVARNGVPEFERAYGMADRESSGAGSGRTSGGRETPHSATIRG